jgi:outer membrane protein
MSRARKALIWPRPNWPQAEQDLIVRVSQAYFDVLASSDTLAFVQSQKTAVAEQLASAKRNFEVGTSTITDSREAQARFDLVVAQETGGRKRFAGQTPGSDQFTGKVMPGTTPALKARHPASCNHCLTTRRRHALWVRPSLQDSTPQRACRPNMALEVAQLETKQGQSRPPAHAGSNR